MEAIKILYWRAKPGSYNCPMLLELHQNCFSEIFVGRKVKTKLKKPFLCFVFNVKSSSQSSRKHCCYCCIDMRIYFNTATLSPSHLIFCLPPGLFKGVLQQLPSASCAIKRKPTGSGSLRWIENVSRRESPALGRWITQDFNFEPSDFPLKVVHRRRFDY